MGKFQLRSLTKPRFGKLWKLLALFSLRIMGVAKAYDFGSRKGKSAKDVDRSDPPSHSRSVSLMKFAAAAFDDTARPFAENVRVVRFASGVLCYCGCSSRCKSTCRDASCCFCPVAHSWFKALFDSGVNPDDVSILAVEHQYG
jgi:hypothetical protein